MNKSFDATGAQFAWDATSLSAAEKCLRYYHYKHIEGWFQPEKSFHLRFGGHYATALEHFYKHRACGDDIDTALEKVVLEALIDTWDGEAGPWQSPDPAKNRENLIRTIVWYVEQFGQEHIDVIKLSDGRPAVEYSFSLDVDGGYVFSGHIDRLVTYAGDPYVMDQKAQPVTTNILTMEGWKKIGDLRVGDKIVGQNGKETEVIGLFPKGITPVYIVYFNDGTSVKCGEDHLWTVATQFSPQWKTLELKELLKAKPHIKFYVPLVEPVQHPTRELPLHPYVLGVLLGSNGYLGGSSIQLSTSHIWLAKAVAERLDGDVIKKSPSDNHVWTISGGRTIAAIRQLGLKGALSANKFIPEEYLFASEWQRRELLRGLLVTDGSWNGKSRIYDSTSLCLTQGICTLVRSLGGTARYRNRKDGAYRVSILLPELPTGAGKRYITGIVPASAEETLCIKVAAADGLYVTENYIVTHNTTGGAISNHYFDGFSPDIQMSMYTFAGKAVYNIPVRGVIIDAAQIMVGFTRYERGFTFRTESQLHEWYDDMMRLIERARKATHENHFPMTRASCGNYGGCEFRSICSRSPEVRQNFLAASFKQGPTWDPLTRR